ncbi:ubiquitin carboxyl-terminal hydrolase 12, partial [Nicotiana attenuata]
YESSVFESCGYKWKLIIYPDGDVEDGHDHISVYLAIAETSSLQAGWEVNATFSFLIFDQIHDNYLIMRGMAQRFHNIKTDWGFSKCISHETYRDPSNSYLVNDKCVFGVDVSVIKNQGLGECVSLLNETKSNQHKWRISEFSKLKDKLYSEEFLVGACRCIWPIFSHFHFLFFFVMQIKFLNYVGCRKLLLYPTGNADQRNNSISIYLVSVDAGSFDRQKRMKAKFSISVKDQISGEHNKRDTSHWFSAAHEDDWGFTAFMPLHEFKNPKGYLVEDCCIVEADVSIIGAVNSLT